MSTAGTTSPGDEPLQEYIVIALAVGIPAALVIIILIVVIAFIFVLMLRKSGNEEEIEAMYMRRRFQGISLEEQMRLQKKRGKKAVVRRRSSAADSKVSVQTNRSARVRSVNPFGLQEWQLKLSGIDVDVDTEETDIDGEEEVGRKPMGAINPLMMERMEEDVADYEPAKRQPPKRPSQTHTSHTRVQVRNKTRLHDNKPQQVDSDSDADSSDSFNPYD